MKRNILILTLVTLLISCNKGQTLDLSTIDFNHDSKEYQIDELSPSRTEKQAGHFEIAYDKSADESIAKDLNSNVSMILKDNGEKVTIYNFDDIKSNTNINFAEQALDSTYGTTIVDYNNKVSFISTSVIKENTLRLINVLEKKLGKPIEIVIGERSIEAVNSELENKLITTFPASSKKVTNELGNDVFLFPEVLIWDKGSVLYQLTLNPVNKEVSNNLVIISKKALKDKIIMGFHNPEKDPLLNKYLK